MPGVITAKVDMLAAKIDADTNNFFIGDPFVEKPVFNIARIIVKDTKCNKPPLMIFFMPAIFCFPAISIGKLKIDFSRGEP